MKKQLVDVMEGVSDDIRLFQLAAQRGAVKLEKLGMRHSKGNITPKLKRFYGLQRSATHDDVIALLQDEIDGIKEAARNGA